MDLLDIGVRVAAGTLSIAFAILLVRDHGKSLTGVFGAVFSFGVVAYLVCSSHSFHSFEPGSGWWLPIVIGCIGNPVFFWLFARSLFEDGMRLTVWDGLLFVGIEVAALLRFTGLVDPYGTICSIASVLAQLAAFALIFHSLFIALRGRSEDLVEGRRRFRLIFVSVVGIYMLLITTSELVTAGVQVSMGLRLANAVAILALTSALFFYLAVLRLECLQGPASIPVAISPSPPLSVTDARSSQEPEVMRDQALLERLEILMEGQKVWRQEGLTISRLAGELTVPEYRLRQAINQGLGYRNFSAFLNRYRLAAAKAALADPAKARLPVLTIALELGYGSIGPFNRVFKDVTGMTPTEFRRASLGALEAEKSA